MNFKERALPTRNNHGGRHKRDGYYHDERLGHDTYTPLMLHSRTKEEWIDLLRVLHTRLKKYPNSIRLKADIAYVEKQIN